MADELTLGGFTFDDFSTPSEMMGGGKQAMVIHKLPGGARVIDTLGPDEDNVTWSGQFFGNDSYANMLSLDAMRAAGQVISLTWGGQFRSVIIDSFVYKVRRIPLWGTYTISCTVYQNPALGNLTSSTSTVDSLVTTDYASALAAGTAPV